MPLKDRAVSAEKIAIAAGKLALGYFQRLDSLEVEAKGHQDFVSQADRDVETFVRAELSKEFPEDSIVGEEHAPTIGSSGFTWVIDPIDGTANFVNGIPIWTVVLAGVRNGRTELGIIYDPCYEETFSAIVGQGASLNGRRLQIATDKSLSDGSIGVGYSNRTSPDVTCKLIRSLLDEGSVFQRNASGALSLAYVAAGRLLGYSEEHMNAWDCLAGQLLIAEAGGCVEEQDADHMIATGGRVIVGGKGVFEHLVRISEVAFDG